MNVELTRKAKELLQDPKAHKELQLALTEGYPKVIKIGNKVYEVVLLTN